MNDKYRIRYQPTVAHAVVDKTIFQKWESKVITTEQARKAIEKSVKHSVSQEAFLINAAWLGYIKEH